MAAAERRAAQEAPAAAERKLAQEATQEAQRKAAQEAAQETERKAAEAAHQRVRELANQGHGPQRHEGQLTDAQLEARARLKHDPETGTRADKYAKNADGTPKQHRCGDHATRVNSEASYEKAEQAARDSPTFKGQEAAGADTIKVETKLEDIYGPNYKDHVSGRTRGALWPDTTTPTVPTNFNDGKMVAIYRKNSSGGYDTRYDVSRTSVRRHMPKPATETLRDFLYKYCDVNAPELASDLW